MKPTYCFRSICDGAYGAMMENCIRTARAAGVFKEFHILTDRPLEECECYDAHQCDKTYGLFKLHYLKVGMSRLNFDYFVWLDADTIFTRNPVDVLDALGKSPIHVPLEANLSRLEKDGLWRGVSAHAIRDLLRQEGVTNEVYLGRSAFWIIHHDAIELIYDLALGFWHKAKEGGLCVDVSVALSYAMQIVSANPEAHVLWQRPDLWASHEEAGLELSGNKSAAWMWWEPLSTRSFEVHAAIVHVPRSKITEPGVAFSDSLCI